MKEMEQENIPEGGTPLSAREIVKINVGNNFRGFGFRPTQPSPSTTSKESLVETELRGIVDIQMKELESTRKELDSTRDKTLPRPYLNSCLENPAGHFNELLETNSSDQRNPRSESSLSITSLLV